MELGLIYGQEKRIIRVHMIGETLQIGLVGLGTVGSGVYEALLRNRSLLEARAQISYAVRKIAVRDKSKARDVVIEEGELTDDWRDLVNDEKIDIIIELIGGTTEALKLVKGALEAGKPVVTGNKALLAEYGAELFRLSQSKGVPLYIEASCGGGIPIVQSLQNSLICNRVDSIVGIINGTSNYVLTSMEKSQISFEKALEQAAKKGYAEADSTLDINGWDAAHKGLILAMIAYGTPLDLNAISVSGIEDVQPADFEFAHRLGYTIKLLVVIKRHKNEGTLELRVQPSFVPLDHLLAKVDGVFNAIAVRGDIVGETIFYGRGAGKNPTSSAVLGDVVLAMRECRLLNYHSGFHPYAEETAILPAKETVTPYYVRFRVRDQHGVIADIAAAFARFSIGISATSSQEGETTRAGEQPWNHLVFILHACKLGQLESALEQIEKLDSVVSEPVVFRIETFRES